MLVHVHAESPAVLMHAQALLNMQDGGQHNIEFLPTEARRHAACSATCNSRAQAACAALPTQVYSQVDANVDAAQLSVCAGARAARDARSMPSAGRQTLNTACLHQCQSFHKLAPRPSLALRLIINGM